MVGTGLSLWVTKRAVKHAKAGHIPLGHQLVEKLNIAAINGLAISTGIYFWASRVIPAGIENRPEWEINSFLIGWALSLVYGVTRPTPRAWVETSLIAGLLFVSLPVLNAVTSPANLISASLNGNWIVAGFDTVAVLTGGTYAWMAFKLHQKQTRPQPVRKPRRRAQRPEDEVPAE